MQNQDYFNYEGVQNCSERMDTIFEEISQILQDANNYMNEMINVSHRSAIYGVLGEKYRTDWNDNASTFGDFYENFHAWSALMSNIMNEYGSFEHDAVKESIAQNQANGDTLEGVQLRRSTMEAVHTLADAVEKSVEAVTKVFDGTKDGDSGAWDSYADAAKAGYGDIKTESQFGESWWLKQKYGSYENYLAAMQKELTGEGDYEGDTSSSNDDASSNNDTSNNDTSSNSDTSSNNGAMTAEEQAMMDKYEYLTSDEANVVGTKAFREKEDLLMNYVDTDSKREFLAKMFEEEFDNNRWIKDTMAQDVGIWDRNASWEEIMEQTSSKRIDSMFKEAIGDAHDFGGYPFNGELKMIPKEKYQDDINSMTANAIANKHEADIAAAEEAERAAAAEAARQKEAIIDSYAEMYGRERAEEIYAQKYGN